MAALELRDLRQSNQSGHLIGKIERRDAVGQKRDAAQFATIQISVGRVLCRSLRMTDKMPFEDIMATG